MPGAPVQLGYGELSSDNIPQDWGSGMFKCLSCYHLFFEIQIKYLHTESACCPRCNGEFICLPECYICGKAGVDYENIRELSTSGPITGKGRCVFCGWETR